MGSAMSESAALPWMVIRQDDNGSRYRVGRYATRTEAQKIADRLAASSGGDRRYLVERSDRVGGGEG
jgi:hypothetical protein